MTESDRDIAIAPVSAHFISIGHSWISNAKTPMVSSGLTGVQLEVDAYGNCRMTPGEGFLICGEHELRAFLVSVEQVLIGDCVSTYRWHVFAPDAAEFTAAMRGLRDGKRFIWRPV